VDSILTYQDPIPSLRQLQPPGCDTYTSIHERRWREDHSEKASRVAIATQGTLAAERRERHREGGSQRHRSIWRASLRRERLIRTHTRGIAALVCRPGHQRDLVARPAWSVVGGPAHETHRWPDAPDASAGLFPID